MHQVAIRRGHFDLDFRVAGEQLLRLEIDLQGCAGFMLLAEKIALRDEVGQRQILAPDHRSLKEKAAKQQARAGDEARGNGQRGHSSEHARKIANPGTDSQRKTRTSPQIFLDVPASMFVGDVLVPSEYSNLCAVMR
jgi:hypothetical protein